MKRVAVIAVHGVGDPGAGNTSAHLAKLLLNLNGTPHSSAIYSEFTQRAISLPVKPLASVPHASVPSSPSSWFDDRGGFIRQLQRGRRPAGLESVPDDVGFTYDMVCGLTDGGPNAVYTTSVHSAVRRTQGGSETALDIYEVYWADLVRLGKGATKALGELYQVTLHLPAIGQRELDLARARCPTNRLLRLYDRTHDWAARVLRLAIPLLNLSLLVIALTAAPLKVLDFLEDNNGFPPWGAAAITTLILFAILFTPIAWLSLKLPPSGLKWPVFWTSATFLLLAISTLFIALASQRYQNRFGNHNLLAIEWLIISCAGLFVIVAIYSKRCPGTELAGSLICVPLVLGALLLTGAFAKNNTDDILDYIFRVITAAWFLLAWTWWLFAFLSFVSALLGLLVAVWTFVSDSTDIFAFRVASTARVTLSLSAALMFLLTLTSWAAITYVGSSALLPATAVFHPPPSLQYLLNFIPAVGPPPYTVRLFAKNLIAASGAQSFLLVLLFVLAAIALACGGLLLPVLGDIWVPRKPGATARAYGKWLNSGNRLLGFAGNVVFISVLLILPIWSILSNKLIGRFVLPTDIDLRGNILGTVGAIVGGITFALFASGRLNSISSKLGPVITAVLDIDAYLRLHPRGDTPRGRIFTRYVSLLRFVSNLSPQYEKVLIVSHSQGTVITCDLLRFLQHFRDDSLEPLGFSTQPRPGSICLDLVTAGSPLNQLYRQRFPNLYWWVSPQVLRPSEVGVSYWHNFYRTGDYIGRWLWRVPADGLLPDVADPVTWSSAPIVGRNAGIPNASEINLGGGAHVHYFDIHAPAVAYYLDRLIG